MGKKAESILKESAFLYFGETELKLYTVLVDFATCP